MRCRCGSSEFKPLGIQDNYAFSTYGSLGRQIYLINCARCGTTISCSRAFYLRLEEQKKITTICEPETAFALAEETIDEV